jgi:RNA polymerase sigma-70 factor (ECF subfamily)
MHVENISLPGTAVGREMRSVDARLVDRIRSGDAEAGRHFVRDHYSIVYRFLLCRTGRPDEAADLTQETFVAAWGALDTFDERAPMRPWLLRIAYREFLQWLRRQRPEASLDACGELPGLEATTELIELREVLRGLPMEEREVVALHYMEGYHCEEIAQILGIPVGRVKHRLVEARARLRRELSDEGSAPQRGPTRTGESSDEAM